MVKLRQVEKNDLPRYKELTDVEKWNHGLSEYELVLERSPTGAFCVELDDGTIAAFCGGYNLDDENVLVYSYVTEKQYRGMGYGSMAFKAVVEWAKGKNLYLNSADGKEAMYGRSGFTKFMWVDYQLVANVKSSDEIAKLGMAIDLTSVEPLNNVTDVLDYDNSISPFSREQVLAFFITNSVKAYLSRDANGLINGYVVCRQLDTCHSLQPFYADTPDVAERLLLKVLLSVPMEKLQFAMPKENVTGWKLVDKYFLPNPYKFKNTNLGRDDTVSPPIQSIYSMLDYMCTIC